jgi:hypothetical protein
MPLQELMYVEKLVARRRILGLDIPQPDGQQQQQQQQSGAAAAGKKRQRQDGEDTEDDATAAATDSAAAAAAADDGEGPEEAAEKAATAAEASDNLLLTQQQGSQPGTPQDPSQGPQAAVRAVLMGTVAKLVFQSALKAAASSKGGSSNYLKVPAAAAAAAAAGSGKGLGFRAGFLEVLGRYKSPGVAGLRQEVLDSIRRDFAQVRKDERVWRWPIWVQESALLIVAVLSKRPRVCLRHPDVAPAAVNLSSLGS